METKRAESMTYSSHGVDAVDVVVGPAGSQLVGVLLLLNVDRKTDSQTLIYHFKMLQSSAALGRSKQCSMKSSSAFQNATYGNITYSFLIVLLLQ